MRGTDIKPHDSLKTFLREDGDAPKTAQEAVFEFRQKISSLQAISDKLDVPRGEDIVMIGTVYGWFWHQIEWCWFDHVSDYLRDNALDRYRIIDPKLHDKYLKEPLADEYRALCQKAEERRASRHSPWVNIDAETKNVRRMIASGEPPENMTQTAGW